MFLTNHVCSGKRQVEASTVSSGEMNFASDATFLRVLPYSLAVAQNEAYLTSIIPSPRLLADGVIGSDE